MRRVKVSLTTAADGTVVGTSPRLSGKLHSIEYVKDPGANPFANGVDFAITKESTGENIWTQADVNASAVVYPRAATHNQSGAAALFAAGGLGVLAPIGLGNDRVKISIAQGGNAKNGSFTILVD